MDYSKGTVARIVNPLWYNRPAQGTDLVLNMGSHSAELPANVIEEIRNNPSVLNDLKSMSAEKITIILVAIELCLSNKVVNNDEKAN
jgi:hypothetical protein